MAKVDAGILQMALIGYEAERQKIENAMAEIQKQLGVRPLKRAAFIVTDEAKPKRRKMSAAARKRIAAAQKKRWAAFHKSKEKPAAKKATAKKAPRKKMSPARKAALVANLKKARAARAAKKTAGEAVPF